MNLSTVDADLSSQTCLPHHCSCKSTERRLAVLCPDDDDAASDLVAAAEQFGWEIDRELEAIAITLRAGTTTSSVADAIGLVRTCAGKEFASLRGAWLEPGKTLRDSVRELLRAPLLSEFAQQSFAPRFLEALENEQIETWFQPVFQLRGGALWGYECLMRLADSQGGVHSPSELITWAEKENLLQTLDRVCRERHIANAAAAGAPEQCHFLINFLPTVIYDPKVCLRSTRRAAIKAGLPFDRIIFEVVETEAVEDAGFLRRILDEYRENGFKVALDDVGAGHAGLTLLAELEPDLVKIDRKLIAGGSHSETHKRVCEAIVGLARSTGKTVLAEGVETEAELDFARDLAVDLVQGYLLGRPAPHAVREPAVAL